MIDYKKLSDERSCKMVQELVYNSIPDLVHSKGNCVWDLSGVNKYDEKISLEVKDRDITHDEFGDILVEDMKRQYTQANYKFDKSFAVNVFNDGYIAICDLYSTKGQNKWLLCPKETWKGGNHELVWKYCLILPQEYLFLKIKNKWTRIKKEGK